MMVLLQYYHLNQYERYLIIENGFLYQILFMKYGTQIHMAI